MLVSMDNVKFIHEITVLSQLLQQLMDVWLETIKILLMMPTTGSGSVLVNTQELQLNVQLLRNLFQ